MYFYAFFFFSKLVCLSDGIDVWSWWGCLDIGEDRIVNANALIDVDSSSTE